MKDKIFINTNIIIYDYSKTEFIKNKITNEIIFSTKCVISTQVINEISNVLLKKFKLQTNEVEDVLFELSDVFEIVNFSFITQLKALKIKEKYKFQFFDSLIIATALENECNYLYSEDMQHNQIIENKLRIINPFIN